MTATGQFVWWQARLWDTWSPSTCAQVWPLIFYFLLFECSERQRERQSSTIWPEEMARSEILFLLKINLNDISVHSLFWPYCIRFIQLDTHILSCLQIFQPREPTKRQLLLCLPLQNTILWKGCKNRTFSEHTCPCAQTPFSTSWPTASRPLRTTPPSGTPTCGRSGSA